MNNTDNPIQQQTPPIQPTPSESQPLYNKDFNRKRNLIVIILVALLILGGSIGGYFLGINRNKSISGTAQNFTPTPNANTPTDTEEPQEVKTGIRIPFVRNGNIYIYEDGQENLIASTTKKSSFESRNDNAYPSLSLNGKFLAYIEYSASSGFVPEGTLKIYNTETKETKTTKYKTSYYHWNIFNQLEFETRAEVRVQNSEGINPAQSKVSFVVFDPQSQQEVAIQTLSYDERNESRIGGFPLYGDRKYLKFKNNAYYLVNNLDNTERLLFERKQSDGFSGWSPDGTYAIFTRYNADKAESIYVAVSTKVSNLPITEVSRIWAGGAGGDAPTGLKWYFNKGFIAYCQELLFFVDGSKPLELTHTGGGGCHNEEGFVSTSPNGEFAFVKFDDRFELHTKNGEKKTINEATTIRKTRSTPKNLIWINNDYMLIYESTFSGSVIGKASANPRIFLFDRNANLIKPVIDNGYLSTLTVGIP